MRTILMCQLVAIKIDLSTCPQCPQFAQCVHNKNALNSLYVDNVDTRLFVVHIVHN